MTDVPYFDAADDRPHAPGSDPSWQESSLFVWHDAKTGLGGFWRLGQEPVAGALNSCFGMFTDELRFRSNVTGVPLAPDDRGEAHMGWGPHLRVTFDGHADIRADFPDCEARLRFDDFHPRYDYPRLVRSPIMGESHHFEVAGRMTGTVRLGDSEVEVDAIGYRDRSWSNRDWSVLRGTRWWPCVFGPDLSLHLLHAFADSGELFKVGYLLRDGEPVVVVDSDIIVNLESDALTPRGGTARIRLETGEELDLRCERRDGIALHVRGYTAMESIGRAYLGDREGFSNLEVCTNATGGAKPPVLAIGANIGDGLSRR